MYLLVNYNIQYIIITIYQWYITIYNILVLKYINIIYKQCVIIMIDQRYITIHNTNVKSNVLMQPSYYYYNISMIYDNI